MFRPEDPDATAKLIAKQDIIDKEIAKHLLESKIRRTHVQQRRVPKVELQPKQRSGRKKQSLGTAVWANTRNLASTLAGLPFAVGNIALESGKRMFGRDEEERELTTRGNERMGNIDANRLNEVFFALDFTDNAYDPHTAAPGWIYKWFEDDDIDIAFLAAYRKNKEPATIVFSFKGTEYGQDGTRDTRVSQGKITEYAGVKLTVPVYGHAGAIARIKGIDKQMTPYLTALAGGNIEPFKADPMRDAGDETKIWGQDEPLIDLLQGDIGGIYVTGHSLGGGCAEVFTAVLAQILNESQRYKVRLITFEAMRGLGTDTFLSLRKTIPGFEYIDRVGIRINNALDMVPNMPGQHAGFTHLGESWYMPKANIPEDIRQGRAAQPYKDQLIYTHYRDIVRQLLDATENNHDLMYKSTGRGVIGKQRKISLVKGSKEAKKYMAWVRSHKK